MKATKVGILGTGDVGRALGTGLITLGHDVMLGGREPKNDKASAWVKKSGSKARQGTFGDAAKFGEIIILATRGSANETAITLAGPEAMAGKIVIDATNPLNDQPNTPPSLAVGHTDSGGEQVQRWLPKSHVVKAFNTVGHAHMVHPEFSGGPPDMFLCGNDADAKRRVAEICMALGWGVIDVGGIEGARLLEPMCIVWVMHGIRSGSWNHAFKLLGR